MESKEEELGPYIPVVLTEFSILKEDHGRDKTYSGHKSLGFSGTENFRFISPSIFGLAQPTAEGVISIVKYFKKKIIWMNLREEPVIYINGRPYVLRDKAAAFNNIRSFVGISYTRLEEMEERLKRDVLEISKRNGGFINVHTEKCPESLWTENVYVQQVQTVREIFEQMDGGSIKYYRTPVSRRLYSKENFLFVLDLIIAKTGWHEEILFGFNCGNGKGRTEYAMAACLINAQASEIIQESDRDIMSYSSSLSEIPDEPGIRSNFSKIIHLLEKIHGKEKMSGWLMKMGNILPALEKAFRGEYILVERLTSIFNSMQSKRIVDSVLRDLHLDSLLKELLENIITAQCMYESKKNIKRAFVLMERYISLIVYGIYKTSKTDRMFNEWIQENPVIDNHTKQLANESTDISIFAPADIITNTGVSLRDSRKWATVIGARTILSADCNFDPYPKEAIENIYIMDQVSGHTLPSHIPKNAIWINLRAEPVVYIKGVPHSEREHLSPHGNIRNSLEITPKLIENQETLLCRRIKNEGKKMHGQIILFDRDADKQLVTKRVNVNEDEVLTCDKFMKKQFAVKQYIRIPFVSRSPLNPNLVDEILQISRTRSSIPIVFQASGLKGRARAARTLLAAVEQAHSLLAAENRTEIPEEIERPIMVKPIETLIRILPNGSLAEKIVRYTYIRTNGKDIYTEIQGEKSDFSPITISNHFMMICAVSFILSSQATDQVFRKWINKRQDIINLFGDLKKESFIAEKSVLVERPWGSVLTPHTMLKNDFFPSLRVNTPSSVDIKGCCNFRVVDFGGNKIIGLAQPTQKGIKELVETLADGKEPFHWFCLRQEPVIYIKGFPYVLRTTDMIYENVITEGITRIWVEDIEERMKNDCLEECRKIGLIVHNEVFKDGQPNLIAEVISVNADEIFTPKELFRNRNLVYYRVPISDEQTPLPEIFDELYRTILSIKKPRKIGFSCQMGRGRTTTGMVISGLISFVEMLRDMEREKREILLEKTRASPVYQDDYPIISKLLQILSYGREGKNVVDQIIEQCSHVQNIYKAIGKQKSTGYLMRYFYLVCFSSFLIETMDLEDISFKTYLSERIEIDAIANENKYYFINQ